jgi:hypothetical protein
MKSTEIQRLLDEQRRTRAEMGSKLDDEKRVNYIIAAQAKAEDPEYLAKIRNNSNREDYRRSQGELSRKYWDNIDRSEVSRQRKESYTEEQRAKVSKQFKGKAKSEAQKKKMSESGKEWHKDENNKKIHAERLARAASKISEANKGKPKTKKTACIYCGVEHPNHTIARHQVSCSMNPNRQVNHKKK